MNKDKIIKDLKEQNRKLKNQYELQEIRLYSSQRIVDNLKEEILEYKGIKGQLLATIDEKNKIIDKAIEYTKKYVDNECIYKGMTRKHNNKDTLLNILRGEDSE